MKELYEFGVPQELRKRRRYVSARVQVGGRIGSKESRLQTAGCRICQRVENIRGHCVRPPEGGTPNLSDQGSVFDRCPHTFGSIWQRLKSVSGWSSRTATTGARPAPPSRRTIHLDGLVAFAFTRQLFLD